MMKTQNFEFWKFKHFYGMVLKLRKQKNICACLENVSDENVYYANNNYDNNNNKLVIILQNYILKC